MGRRSSGQRRWFGNQGLEQVFSGPAGRSDNFGGLTRLVVRCQQLHGLHGITIGNANGLSDRIGISQRQVTVTGAISRGICRRQGRVRPGRRQHRCGEHIAVLHTGSPGHQDAPNEARAYNQSYRLNLNQV